MVSLLATSKFREIGGISYYVSERYPRLGDAVLLPDYDEPKIGKIIRKVDEGLFDIEMKDVRSKIPREWIKVVDEVEESRETIESLTEKINVLMTRIDELEGRLSDE